MDFFRTYTPINEKQRLGRDGDGGYITVRGYTYDACLSCGISDDPSFDVAFHTEYPDVPVYAFDGTVDRPHELPDAIPFIKKNIAPFETEHTTHLHDILAAHSNVFLKMDIEGHEWAWLDALPVELLRNIRQIVIEFHGMINNAYYASIKKKRRVLEKLATTHSVVHVHGNNNARLSYHRGIPVPYVIEVTYLRKDDGNAGLNTRPFPVPGLDMQNSLIFPEIPLTWYPFVSASATDDTA
jgi:hypothetical protein